MRLVLGSFEDVMKNLLGEETIDQLAKPVVRLENWTPVMSPSGRVHLYGQAYGHPRFRDGEFVTTTPITGYAGLGSLIETRNTFYHVIGKPREINRV